MPAYPHRTPDWRAAAAAFCLIAAGAAADDLSDANELYRQEKFPEAIAAYRRALDQGANPSMAWFNLGNTYYRIDSVAAAAVCYQSALQEAPDFCRAHLNLGILYYNMDLLGPAAAALERARACDPANAQALLILAAVYHRLEPYAAAVPLAGPVAVLEPGRHEPYFLLFEINRELGDWTEARSWLERWPDSLGHAADKYQMLGELAEEYAGPREAAVYLRRLIEIAPDRRWGWFRLVRCLLEQDAVLSGLELAEEALERFRDFAELALLAGNRAFDEGYLRRAEGFYRAAYRIGSPGGAVGIQNLVRAYEAEGNGGRARELARFAAASGVKR